MLRADARAITEKDPSLIFRFSLYKLLICKQQLLLSGAATGMQGDNSLPYQNNQ